VAVGDLACEMHNTCSRPRGNEQELRGELTAEASALA